MFPRENPAGDAGVKMLDLGDLIHESAMDDSSSNDPTPEPPASPTSMLADPLASLLSPSAAPRPAPLAAITPATTVQLNTATYSFPMQLVSGEHFSGPSGTTRPLTVPPAAEPTTPSAAASAMTSEALHAALNTHLPGLSGAAHHPSTTSVPFGAAFPQNESPATAMTTPSPATSAVSSDAQVALMLASARIAGSGTASPFAPFSSPLAPALQPAPGADGTAPAPAPPLHQLLLVANPAYPFSMQFVTGAPLPGSPGSPAAASTPSPAASAVSSDAYVAAMLASAQLTASGAGSPFSPFSSPPPQTPVLPVGANGISLPLAQLMQALEQAQAMATQLAAGGNASPIPATTPPPRALEYALVTSATLMADATLTDARNAAGPFVCGESSSLAWTVTMQDSPASKPSSSSKTSAMCELYLHVLLEGADNQPLVPTPDAIVRMHVKIEIQSLKRPDMPMETVFDGWHAFTARPVVELPVRFTRVLAKAENQRENRLKVTLTPVGGEPMVVAGLPSTITCQSRRTGDRNKTKQTIDDSPTAASSSSSSPPAPPTPTPAGQTSKKRSVGQRDTASTDLLAAIPDDQVEDVRRLIVNGGAVAEIGKILRGCKVPYEVRRDLLETVLRVHLVTNPYGQRGPWSAAEFDSVVTLLSSLPGKPVWTDHNFVHDVAQRCFDRDQLRVIFRPLLPTTPTSPTATPASSAATALRLALVTPDKFGRTPAHVAAYSVNVEFLVLVGQVYPMALAQLNPMTKASFLHSLAGRDGAAGALQRLRNELPPWLIEQAVTAVDTYGCTPLAMAEFQAKVRKRDEVWPTVEMLSEMVAAMQVA